MWYSNLGHLTPQSGMLLLDHCRGSESPAGINGGHRPTRQQGSVEQGRAQLYKPVDTA